MGLFSSRGATDDPITSSRELADRLRRVPGLSQRERKVVFRALRSQLDMGKLSRYEIKEVLRRLDNEGALESDDRKRVARELLG